jgi:glutathione S-transferase
MDGWMHAESRKILRHIADKYKNQGYRDLFGPGALERASIEQWLQTEAQSFDVPSADMVYSLAYLPPDMQLDGRGGGGLPEATGTTAEGGGDAAAVREEPQAAGHAAVREEPQAAGQAAGHLRAASGGTPSPAATPGSGSRSCSARRQRRRPSDPDRSQIKAQAYVFGFCIIFNK